mgnify:CR=1 FL=1
MSKGKKKLKKKLEKMNSLKVTIAFAVIAAVSAGSDSYVKRYDGHSQGGQEEAAGISSGSWNEGGSAYKGGDFYAYPKYKFEYGVKDAHTHDHKSQWEQRDGDKVVGEYTLEEADGTTRKVSYHADAKSGFHAKVERIGHAHHHDQQQQYAYGGAGQFGGF